MGCSSSRFHKPKGNLIKTHSYILDDKKSYLGYSDSSSSSSHFKCLKIRFPQEEKEDLIFNINLLENLDMPCLDEIKSLYKVCNNFESSLSYFEMLVHGVCIPDYDIIKGLMILSIYLQLHVVARAKVSVLRRFPYIIISVENKMWNKKNVDSFENIIDCINALQKKVNLSKTLLIIKRDADKFNKNLNQGSDLNARLVSILLYNIIDFGTQVENKVKKCLNDLQEFSKNFISIDLEIKNIIKTLRSCHGENIEKIVHEVYSLRSQSIESKLNAEEI